MRLIEVALDNLRNHPLNAKVFGQLSNESDSDSFLTSITRWGVQIPLHVAPAREDGSYLILSGHRRRQAAAKAGYKTVPCLVRDDANSPEMIDLIWSESNLQREMTTEQRARFFESRTSIEAALAKVRMAVKSKVREIPVGKTGEAKDRAAEAAGLSRKTAEKAVEVTHRIDELEQQGKQQDAAKLRETLNTKSVAAAHREATGEPDPEPQAGSVINGKPDALTLSRHVMGIRNAGKAAESWTDDESRQHVIDELRKWIKRLSGDDAAPSKFVPPTVDEIESYCQSKNIRSFDAEKFVNSYAAKGWMIGKSKMKDWKRAVLNSIEWCCKAGKHGRAIPDDYGKAGVLS